MGTNRPTAVTFQIGTGFSDRQRETPPPFGSTVTFKYQELTADTVPRFPVFVGERLAPPAETAPLASAPPRGRRADETAQPAAAGLIAGKTAKGYAEV